MTLSRFDLNSIPIKPQKPWTSSFYDSLNNPGFKTIVSTHNLFINGLVVSDFTIPISNHYFRLSHLVKVLLLPTHHDFFHSYVSFDFFFCSFPMDLWCRLKCFGLGVHVCFEQYWPWFLWFQSLVKDMENHNVATMDDFFDKFVNAWWWISTCRLW